ncbi:MAG: hypothetical protein HQ495_00220 [Alphaproteobacteria bacterium]|nr:hypothetical protein [Alphaproteobacteria bacterium]
MMFRPKMGGMGSLFGLPLLGWIGTTIHSNRGPLAGLAIATMLFAGTTGMAVAQDVPHVLTGSGAALGTMQSDGTLDDLRLTVTVGGDTVESTHVWAIVGGSELRQRTNNGYWVPWTGEQADLIDNQFAIENGQVVFKLVDGSIAADNQGITFVIGYRSDGVLKYGTLGVLPKSGGGS